MSLIDILSDFFKKPKEGTAGQTPEGLCPNCWGHGEYDGVFREIVIDKQVDVNDHRANHAFIQDFVVNHLNGIQLKNSVHGQECPTCKYVQK